MINQVKLSFVCEPFVNPQDELVGPLIREDMSRERWIVHNLYLNSYIINSKHFTWYDGTQITADKALLLNHPLWSKDHVLHEIPYISVYIPYDEKYTKDNKKLEFLATMSIV